MSEVIPAQAGTQGRLVIPAQAGIQGFGEGRYALLGPRLRGDDVLLMTSVTLAGMTCS